MGSFSIWHWLIVLVVVLVLFGGRGKIPNLMGDIAKGIKSFKSNMKEEDVAGPNTAESKKIDAETNVSESKTHDDKTPA